MTVSNGLGTYGDGAGVVTPTDHKLAHLGLVTKVGGGTNAVRAGLFYDGVSNIVTGTANMSYNVAPFTAVSSRGAASGAVLFVNDGTVNVVTTAAPGSNSRIDIVYAWQREFSLDGGSTTPTIAVANGTPAASPTAPSLSAYPGAIELARITVPAGVTATNSGTTITQTAPFTTVDGAPIPVRNVADLPAAAVTGARARTIDSGVIYEWSGSAWSIPALGLRDVLELTSSTTFTKATYPWLRAIRVKCIGGGGGGGGAATTGAGQVAIGANGAGGGYSESFITNISGLASSVTVTVGTGGTAGTAGNNAGGNGNASSFGSLVIANGGGGGGGSAAATPSATQAFTSGSATSATAGTGDIAVPGPEALAPGAFTAFGFAFSEAIPGTALGGSAGVLTTATGQAGTAGALFGGGGRGGINAASQGSARAGGAGAAGIVIIELYA